MSPGHFIVTISSNAEEDLRAIADFVARERSLDEAIALVDSITVKIDPLERFPMRGPVPDEVRSFGEDDFRQMFVGPYRIFYVVEDQKVTIVMVADGRREMFALLRQRASTVLVR